ncbi:hypothetical protein EUTSA_v10001923mg [Eutrema salsugineum]|uniref:Phorbol-ester/DAG-type domain-containing protein n=1 Tax=Eutrema salsugineum TaxID=72664 RepID=V4M5R8_EUTSA|nr:uncharacterized protein LOC18025763 [Eutrema salsugineum]ESQ50337.1 hypothetical protein EUTSA_v10001923mg [Eutrema salsugineum]
MDLGSKQIKIPLHEHPLLPVTRFAFGRCQGCLPSTNDYIYGGYRCNELGCEAMFHKECAESLPEINHYSHPDHPLKLILQDSKPFSTCSFCRDKFKVGYCCSVCDFHLDLRCAWRPSILEKSNAHEHPLEFLRQPQFIGVSGIRSDFCKVCDSMIFGHRYKCHQCDFAFHLECADAAPEAEAYHTSHPQHPLKFLTCKAAPDYAYKNCLLCGTQFDDDQRLPRLRLHHCDVCNFSLCEICMQNPPPVSVVSLTTHEHNIHLVPRRIEFTCNACGTLGNQSPYFCLQCNFMIHRECIDLPRVININRHDHRVSYTPRLGHEEWKCGVCRQKVDGFYGAYSCSKCPSFAVHSRCATSKDVWDMVELEGTPEEPEEPAPFEIIDDNTIKHFSHDHNLQIINKDELILHENIVCAACIFQVCSEPSFYSCNKCDFVLHEKCANLPRKKRHVCHNQRFTLGTVSHLTLVRCGLCLQRFTGFVYRSNTTRMVLDVRCGSFSEPFVHKSHPHHALYYTKDPSKYCSECGKRARLSCGECNFSLDFECAFLPEKVMNHRYDDHPLFLSCGESNVDGKYWCEACETEVNPNKWFYTCNDCGVVLHISCVVGDREFSYMMPGSSWPIARFVHAQVVSNTSICRPFCRVCKTRCKLPSIIKINKINYTHGVDVYICSFRCLVGVSDYWML